MDHLPDKSEMSPMLWALAYLVKPKLLVHWKGLSNHYEGKSESFESLVNFKNIEDIAKKRNHRSNIAKM
ncbi:hypothetical protein R6Q57_013743 [Mikania cordata]